MPPVELDTIPSLPMTSPHSGKDADFITSEGDDESMVTRSKSAGNHAAEVIDDLEIPPVTVLSPEETCTSTTETIGQGLFFNLVNVITERITSCPLTQICLKTIESSLAFSETILKKILPSTTTRVQAARRHLRAIRRAGKKQLGGNEPRNRSKSLYDGNLAMRESSLLSYFADVFKVNYFLSFFGLHLGDVAEPMKAYVSDDYVPSDSSEDSMELKDDAEDETTVGMLMKEYDDSKDEEYVPESVTEDSLEYNTNAEDSQEDCQEIDESQEAEDGQNASQECKEIHEAEDAQEKVLAEVDGCVSSKEKMGGLEKSQEEASGDKHPDDQPVEVAEDSMKYISEEIIEETKDVLSEKVLHENAKEVKGLVAEEAAEIREDKSEIAQVDGADDAEEILREEIVSEISEEVEKLMSDGNGEEILREDTGEIARVDIADDNEIEETEKVIVCDNAEEMDEAMIDEDIDEEVLQATGVIEGNEELIVSEVSEEKAIADEHTGEIEDLPATEEIEEVIVSEVAEEMELMAEECTNATTEAAEESLSDDAEKTEEEDVSEESEEMEEASVGEDTEEVPRDNGGEID